MLINEGPDETSLALVLCGIRNQGVKDIKNQVGLTWPMQKRN